MESQKPLWTITGVSDFSEFHPDAGLVAMKRVDYVLHDGTKSYVTMPIGNFSPENVAGMVHDAAVELAQIMELEGPAHAKGARYQGPPGKR